MPFIAKIYKPSDRFEKGLAFDLRRNSEGVTLHVVDIMTGIEAKDGAVFTITNEGKLRLHSGFDPSLAAELGIRLDAKQRIARPGAT